MGVTPIISATVNMPAALIRSSSVVASESSRKLGALVVSAMGVLLRGEGCEGFGSVAQVGDGYLAPGQYATCLALGLFRLGGSPAFTVTADVTASGPSSAAAIARQMLLDLGLTTSELDADAFDALATLSPAQCGVMVEGDTSALAAISQVLGSVGGWIVPNGEGVFTVGRLELPRGAPIARFQEWQIRGDLERLTPSGSNRGIPAYRVTVRYGRLGRTQKDSDLAGAVDAGRRASLAIEWRSVVVENTAVRSRHLLAQEMTFDTCLVNAADAQAEAERLLAIYSARRDIWRIRVDMTNLDYRVDQGDGDPFTMAIGLGAEVSLSASRFLTPAKNFIVIGRVEDCMSNRIQFDLWG